MDYERLYEYRFRDVDQAARAAAWREIARFLARRMGDPERVLDPAAGRLEFINAVPAAERWAVDRVAYPEAERDDGVRMIVADAMDADLPRSHFDAIFISNLLEHLPAPDAVYDLLVRMRECARPGGVVAVLGPNFRHCADEYFDCADHVLALTDVAVAEHLQAAGLTVVEQTPRFLPYSFRGRLPAAPALVRLYLRFPPAWRFLGKQFFVMGRRER